MVDFELKLMETIEYIKGKIKELKDHKEKYGDPDDIWDEISISDDLRLDAYRDVLDFIEKRGS